MVNLGNIPYIDPTDIGMMVSPDLPVKKHVYRLEK